MVGEAILKELPDQNLSEEDISFLRNDVSARNAVLNAIQRLNRLPFDGTQSCFLDNTWTFYDLEQKKENVPEYKQVFRFSENSRFTVYYKLFVIDELLRGYLKRRTILNRVRNIIRIFTSFEKEYYLRIESIPLHAYENYLNALSVTYSTKCQYKVDIRDFLKFYELSFKKSIDDSVFAFLKEKDKKKIKIQTESNKVPALNEEFRIVLKRKCKRIMESADAPNNDRIIAASLNLYTEIGFRTGELSTVTTDSLRCEDFEGAKLYYLDFKTYKKSYGDAGTRDAHAYVSEDAKEAYEYLLKLCDKRRKEIGTNALIVADHQRNSTIDVKSFNAAYKRFLVRNYKELGLLEENGNFKFLTIKTYLRSLNTKEREDLKRKISIDAILYYPEIRQFRVSKCTNLYKNNVPMRYIKEHMTHLTEEMSEYYVRSENFVDKNATEKVYSQIYKEGANLLGHNADAFVKKVDDYLKKHNVKVIDSIDQAVKLAGEAFPLRAKVGGVCIRCGNVIPCADEKITDKAYCSYGMCPNHCHMYYMINITYNQVLEHIRIIRFNEKNNHLAAVKKEENKLKYLVKNALKPEYDELLKMIDRKGCEYIIGEFPQLTKVMNELDNIGEVIVKWA